MDFKKILELVVFPCHEIQKSISSILSLKKYTQKPLNFSFLNFCSHLPLNKFVCFIKLILILSMYLISVILPEVCIFPQSPEDGTK